MLVHVEPSNLTKISWYSKDQYEGTEKKRGSLVPPAWRGKPGNEATLHVISGRQYQLAYAVYYGPDENKE